MSLFVVRHSLILKESYWLIMAQKSVILVTGATGQIGSELVPALRKIYGNENVSIIDNFTRELATIN